MNIIERIVLIILDIFGIRYMPWIVRFYFALLLMFVVLASFASKEATDLAANSGAVNLYRIASHAIELILGAILGALSMAVKRTWGVDRRREAQASGASSPPGSAVNDA